jgi:hypothetical protein
MLTWDQIRMQNRMDAVLEPRHLRNELSALGDTPAQHLSIFVRHPYLRKEPARVQLGEHCGVDLIGFNLCPGDSSHLERICNNHATHEWSQQTNDDRGVAGRFQDDFIAQVESLAELNDTSMLQ